MRKGNVEAKSFFVRRFQQVDGFEIVDVTGNTSKDFLSADCTDFRRLFSLGFSSAFICGLILSFRMGRECG
ncbi:MAG: hypothetical protein COW89_09125 [Nitrospinae bacterium CG22_combo_CG10-13_8_21_14_all_47_10]|nr:MAG: hypothetical protein COW89_09125 [Nitrospinae bacterium CG22_combo_CG10-13_8_21_14_all_47_10]